MDFQCVKTTNNDDFCLDLWCEVYCCLSKVCLELNGYIFLVNVFLRISLDIGHHVDWVKLFNSILGGIFYSHFPICVVDNNHVSCSDASWSSWRNQILSQSGFYSSNWWSGKTAFHKIWFYVGQQVICYHYMGGKVTAATL